MGTISAGLMTQMELAGSFGWWRCDKCEGRTWKVCCCSHVFAFFLLLFSAFVCIHWNWYWFRSGCSFVFAMHKMCWTFVKMFTLTAHQDLSPPLFTFTPWTLTLATITLLTHWSWHLCNLWDLELPRLLVSVHYPTDVSPLQPHWH